MSSSLVDKKVSVFSVAAGSALDQTYTKYVSMRNFDKGSMAIRWTAGSGGGTVAIKAYACVEIYGTEADALAADTGDVFQDVSNEILGAATLSADTFLIDDVGTWGSVPWIKFTAVIANKDAATSLYVDLYQKEVQ